MQSTKQRWILKNLEDTIALGETMPRNITDLKILLLQGPLGAGKTSLVKGIAKTLGILEPITSPTFNLSQHYSSGKPPLVHIDLYRLENANSAYELFLQEEEEANQMNALIVIEWPERLQRYIDDAWHMQIEYLPNGERRAELSPPGKLKGR